MFPLKQDNYVNIFNNNIINIFLHDKVFWPFVMSDNIVFIPAVLYFTNRLVNSPSKWQFVYQAVE